MDKKPIKCLDITGPFEGDSLDVLIPRRKKSVEEPKQSNGVVSNGTTSAPSAPNSNGKSSIKRTASEGAQEGWPLTKRSKTIPIDTTDTAAADAPILVEDSANGAILIDDD